MQDSDKKELYVQGETTAVASNPSLPALVVATDAETFYWDYATDRAWRVSDAGPEDPLTALAFSPDGEFFVGGSETGRLTVWSSVDGTVIATRRPHEEWVTAVGFDGTRIVSSSDDAPLVVWNPSSDAPVRRFEVPGPGVETLVFASDGSPEVRAVGRNRLLRFDLTNVSPVSEAGLPVPGNPWAVAAFSDDGRFLGNADSGVISVFDLETGVSCPVAVVAYEGPAVTALAADAGLLIAGRADGSVSVWAPRVSDGDGREASCVSAGRTFRLVDGPVAAVMPGIDGCFVAADSAGRVIRFEVERIRSE